MAFLQASNAGHQLKFSKVACPLAGRPAGECNTRNTVKTVGALGKRARHVRSAHQKAPPGGPAGLYKFKRNLVGGMRIPALLDAVGTQLTCDFFHAELDQVGYAIDVGHLDFAFDQRQRIFVEVVIHADAVFVDPALG